MQCAVNGHHYIEYKHRIKDLSRINTIAIDGKCTIYSIRFEGGAAVAHQQVCIPAHQGRCLQTKLRTKTYKTKI